MFTFRVWWYKKSQEGELLTITGVPDDIRANAIGLMSSWLGRKSFAYQLEED